MKRQPAEGETIFAHDKRLTPKRWPSKGSYLNYRNNTYNSISKKHPKSFLKKWEDLNRHFCKEKIQITRTHKDAKHS